MGADAGVTGLDEAPNGMTTAPEEMASSSPHSSLPSSEENLSASNVTQFESSLEEPTSSDSVSPNPCDSNNSVSEEGIPADGKPTSRKRLNPSLTADPERKRQIEARLKAIEKRAKVSTLKEKKKEKKNSRPLSSPYTNMMRWNT